MRIRTNVSLPVKIGLLLCLMYLTMADSCSPDCKSCGHPAHVQLVVTWNGGNDPLPKSTDDNGCISYNSHSGDCGTVTDPVGGTEFSFSPGSVDLTSPPGTFTATGSGLVTTYGMPVVQFFDESGTSLGSATASSVSTDGTTLTVTTPDLSSAYSGFWTLVVSNKTSTSGLSVVGIGGVEATGRDYPSCNPSDDQLSNCESQLGFFWDYDTCRCVDGNP